MTTTEHDFATAMKINAKYALESTCTPREAYVLGALDGRSHLARQEPTDAEVEAAAESLCGADMEVHGFSSEEAVNILHGRWVRLEDTHRNAYLATARAALTAAKEARHG